VVCQLLTLYGNSLSVSQVFKAAEGVAGGPVENFNLATNLTVAKPLNDVSIQKAFSFDPWQYDRQTMIGVKVRAGAAMMVTAGKL